MKNKLLPILAVISLSFSILMALPCLTNTVSEASMVSDNLIQEGIEFYKKKDFPKAIEQLSKALIIDPDNKTALEYMQKMGLERGIYAPETSRTATPMQEMANEVHDYKDQLSAMEEEKFEQEKLAQTLAEDKETLQRGLKMKEDEMENLRQELSDMQTQLVEQEALVKPGPSMDEKKLARQEEDIYQLKSRISRQLALIDQKDHQIKELQKDVKSSQKQMKQNNIKYEHKLIDIKEDFNKYKSKSWRKEVKTDEKVEYLRHRLRQSKAQIDEFNSNFLLANQKLVSLENQLAVRSKTIEELNKSGRNQNCPPAQAQAAKDCPDKEVLKKQDEEIAQLKEKLAKVKNETFLLRKNLTQNGKEDVTVLQQQLADIETQLRKKDARLADEEASYEILEERLKDAQERLNLADQMIKEKDTQVREMEQQIGNFNKQEKASDVKKE